MQVMEEEEEEEVADGALMPQLQATTQSALRQAALHVGQTLSAMPISGWCSQAFKRRRWPWIR